MENDVYRDKDVSLQVLDGKVVAVIGYGIQGGPQALCMRDSGLNVIVGAGPDWVEARFIRPPKDMLAFAKKIRAFAPDTVPAEAGPIDKLAKKMAHSNRFFLIWD